MAELNFHCICSICCLVVLEEESPVLEKSRLLGQPVQRKLIEMLIRPSLGSLF